MKRQLSIACFAFPFLLSLIACQGQLTPYDVGSGQLSVHGGKDVQESDPIRYSIVGIRNEATNTVCTGTLIAPGVVITAAHCLSVQLASQMKVFFALDMSEVDRRKDEQMISAERVIISSRYRESYTGWDSYDFGFIRFNPGLMPAWAVPAKLPAVKKVLFPGIQLNVAGYGISNLFFKSGSGGQLRKALVPIKHYTPAGSEVIMNQSSAKQGICDGDSGGPLYAIEDGQVVLYGVTAGTIQVNNQSAFFDCKNNSLFTYIPFHLDSIKTVLGNMNYETNTRQIVITRRISK